MRTQRAEQFEPSVDSAEVIFRILILARRKEWIGASICILSALLISLAGVAGLGSIPTRSMQVAAWGVLLAGLLFTGFSIWRWRGVYSFKNAARRLERKFPSLRTDLSTWLEWVLRGKVAPRGFSSVLYERLENAVADEIGRGEIQDFVGVREVIRSNRFPIFLSLFAALFLVGGAPTDWLGILTRTFQGSSVGPQDVPVGELKAGNFRVTVHPPAYAKLSVRPESDWGSQPLEVLRGSRIDLSYRLGREVSSSSLVLPGGEVILASSPSKGFWKVVFTPREGGPVEVRGVDEGKEIKDSLARRLVVSADHAPEVKLESPPIQVDADIGDSVSFRYSASDDFGLVRTEMEVEIGGSKIKTPISKPADRFDRGTTLVELKKLPILTGTREITATITAWDNDEVTGSKEGRSPTVHIRLKLPEESREERLKSVANRLEILLSVLADDLEEHRSAPAARKDAWLSSWEENGRRLSNLLNDLKGPVPKNRRERGTVLRLKSGLEARVSERSKAERIVEQDWSNFQSSYDPFVGREIEGLESLIAFLDRISGIDRAERMGAMAKEAEGGLESLLNQLKAKDSKPSSDEMIDAVEKMKKILQDLASSMASLAEKAPPEFMNPDAIREMEMGRFDREMNEIGRLIREGRLQEARKKLIEELAKLKSMAKKMRESGDRTRKMGDESLRKEFSEILEKLGEVRRKQSDLRDETREFEDKRRNRKGGVEKEDLKKILETIDALKRALDQAAVVSKGEHSEPWKTLTERGLPELQENTAKLKKDVLAKRIASARLKSALNFSRLNALERKGNELKGIFGRAFPDLGGVRTIRGYLEITKARELAEEIDRLLNPPEDGGGSPMTEEERGKSERLAKRQKDLEGEALKLDERLRGFQRKIRMESGEPRPLSEASRSMQGARSDLEKGDAGSAIPKQRDALEALERAGNEMNQAAEEMSSWEGGNLGFLDGPEGERENGTQGLGSESILIPESEKKKETEEWRRKLLEGMKQKPPEGYEDVTREYFEEMLKQ